MYNEAYRYYPNYRYIHWTDIHTWDFKECICAKPKQIKRYFTQPRFFEKLEFMDNAKEVLDRLKDKFEIVIVSMGVQPNLFGKEIWIKDNIPFAKFIGIDMKKYKDKSSIDMSGGILIDDERRYLDSSNADMKICFGDEYEWNKDWKGKRCFKMGCRTLIGYDRHGLGYIRQGRGNNVPNTIILPKLGIEYGICLGKRENADLNGFWNALDDALNICEKGLLERYEIIKSQSPEAAPFMYQNNTIKGSRECDDTVENAVKHGTLGFGIIGMAEMCVALFGKNHAEDEQVHEFALSVVKHIYNYTKEASNRNDLNFGTYFTPAEGLCRTALTALRNQYGVIENVTSHEFLTNSIHVPVWQKISIYDKLRVEAPFTKYATSGCITYIELESTFIKNTKAVEDIIDYAFNELDIPYLAFNFPIDSCLDCGYQGEFNDVCPECGSKNIQQLRRVTGYLTTDYRNFNDGKQAEVKERVKHNAYTDFGE